MRAELPPRTLPDGSIQARVTTAEYNPYGQPIRSTDEGHVVTRQTYHPETDPSGSGESNPGRDPATGGYLKDTIADADAGSIYNGGVAIPITTTRTWNPIGDAQTITDGRGVRTTFVTNELHQVVRTIAADDTSFVPTRRNEPVAVPALSIVSETDFDANDNVVAVRRDNRDNRTSHAGAFIETRMQYDLLDRVLRIEEEVTATELIVTTMRYDASENLISELRQAVAYREVTMTYDARNLVLTVTRGAGAEASTATHHVDKNGSSTGVTDAVDNARGVGLAGDGVPERTTLVRDGYDRVVKSIDRMGNFTELVHDPASQVVESSFFGHPGGNPTGAPILMRQSRSLHDEAGAVTFAKARLFVDAGQVLFAGPPALDTDDDADPEFVTVTTWRDPNGLTTLTSVPNRELGAQESRTVYDGHRRVIEGTDAAGNRGTFVYNDGHLVVERTDIDHQPAGVVPDESFVFRMFYDALGRRVEARTPLGHTTRWTWGTLWNTAVTDAQGPVIADPLGSGTINGPGNETRTRRDGLGRTLKVTQVLTVDGQGGSAVDTSNPFNADGLIDVSTRYHDALRKVVLVDDNGNETTTTIDTRGNAVRVRNADGTTREATFNQDDQPVLVVDPNGNRITQHFDPLGRLFARDVERGPGVIGTTRQELSYDGASRVVRTFDNGGEGVHAFESELACAYDSFGNGLEEVHNGRIVAREWKSGGDPVTLRYPSGLVLDYATDPLDRLTRIRWNGQRVASWEYVGGRTLRRRLGHASAPASRSVYGYDADRRLTSVTHRRESNEELISQYVATYNRASHMTSQQEAHFGNVGDQYRYDSAYRLIDYRTGVADPSGPAALGATLEEAWKYDGLGNWSEKTTNVEQGGAATIAGVPNEMNEYTSFAGAAQTHDDNGNRLMDDRHTYRWDAFNRLREVREVGTGDVLAVHSYHVDARRTRSELMQEPVGTRSVRYAWDDLRLVEESRPSGAVRAITMFGRGSELVARVGGSRRYIFEDAKRWVREVTNGAAIVKERYRYAAHGDVVFLDASGNLTCERGDENPWLYHQYYRDQDGHFYTIYRYLDCYAGRWLSRDPLESQRGGPYVLCGSAPVGNTDLTGLLESFTVSCEPVEAYNAGKLIDAVHCRLIACCDDTEECFEYDLIGGGLKARPKPIPYAQGRDARARSLSTNARHESARIVRNYFPVSYTNSLVEGEERCCSVFERLKREHLTAVVPPYKYLGPNSNTYVSYLMQRVGLRVMPYLSHQRLFTAGRGAVFVDQMDTSGVPRGAIGWGDFGGYSQSSLGAFEGKVGEYYHDLQAIPGSFPPGGPNDAEKPQGLGGWYGPTPPPVK